MHSPTSMLRSGHGKKITQGVCFDQTIDKSPVAELLDHYYPMVDKILLPIVLDT